MNTILLQKILDILTEGLAHVGNFFKDLFISDPQAGQVIGYEAGKWKNIDLAELSFDFTNNAGPADIITISDAAADMSMKSLVVDIVPKQASGTPTPESPLPITGFTGANITHTGKNLFNPSNVLDAYLNTSGVIKSNINTKLVYSKCNPNTTYTVSKTAGQRFQVAYCDSLPIADLQCGGMISDSTSSSISITTNATAKYIVAYIYHGSYDTVTPEQMLATVQIEEGSQATTYEPYTATIYPISWQTEAGTVYGGWYDVTTGKLRVTHAIVDMGDLTWDKNTSTLSVTIFTASVSGRKAGDLSGICSDYAVSSDTRTYLETHDNCLARWNASSIDICLRDDSKSSMSGAEIKTALSGVNLVYELATPIEYTLTPTQIKTRGGTESIWSDTGDVEGEYYTTTAGTIKNIVSITEDITSEVTANTTDWSSVQYKVVKNNNVVTVYLYSATTTEHGSVELFSGLPRAAYNGPVLLYDTDNSTVVNAKVDTSGYLDVTLFSGGTVKGTITYVAK